MRTRTISAMAFFVFSLFFASAIFAAPAPPPGPGGVPDYFGTANWAFSPPLEKFIDSLPPAGCSTTNNLLQCIPIAVPDTVTYPGTDYYEIKLQEYQEKFHSNLPATKLRGYVQTNNGTDVNGSNTVAPAPIHYLGPIIKAQKDRPVRIKFTNALPTGTGGDLFLPVDTTTMGAGFGPLGPGSGMYTQNRAVIHLHGGHTPWISDGTPHQWITPAGETTNYPKGTSVLNVPDMPDPGAGSSTLFYPNQQSSRMLFYHDHAYGITRLNVYAGEAAGYFIEDDAEKYLKNAGIIPIDEIPLIIQDKSFVNASTVLTTDPTWNWGTTPPTPNTGDLWYPHVYMPAQNPFDVSGVNPFGRWPYGPWFWPPTLGITHPPIPNPYYDPACVPSATVYCQPPEIPATPNPSMPAESFMDTAMVNGTIFPYLNVDPKSYRLRILNASNDRFWNLQLYVADNTVISADGRTNTEVKMVPATVTPGFPAKWPTDGRVGGVPDPTKVGPSFIQIGNEGGFLPLPAVIPNQPIAWNNDPTTFNFGNVSDHALLLAPAERADVIVDFSQYAGKTLILYNDAPAAFPAIDVRYDYYTGAPNLSSTGGHTGPQIGFGPNTRTVMQFRVSGTTPPSPAFDLATLQANFVSTATSTGIFEAHQNPILVGQTAYNLAYNQSFPLTWPNWGISRISDTSLTFNTVTGTNLSIPMKNKGIHDEMGAAFDMEYGRLSSRLGIELATAGGMNQNFILYNFLDPATEIITDSITPGVPTLGDGTQVWKITHNGVDTHPIHFHLFDVQLINRVGWDGMLRLPDQNELGWKETVRVSPLEDTIVAFRATAPKVPFVVPNSIRMMNTTEPAGSTMGFTNIDPLTGQPTASPIVNQLTDFGWEYVWHCHILSHEEMDMMRPMSFQVASPNTYVVPHSPMNVSAVAGNAKATISFLPPATNNGTPITSYIVTANPGGLTATKATSPIAITGLLNGTVYNFTVVAVNSAGKGLSSLPSNNVMPVGPTTYSITVTSGTGGLVQPSGIIMVNQGTNQSFTITPNTGYSIASLTVDGAPTAITSPYTFSNVLANHTIAATFAINTFTITTTAGLGGTISPNPSATVNYGANQTFTITPDLGFHVVDVLIDGISVGAMTSYTFNTVIANHTIAATFAINTYTLASSTGPNGTISPLGTTSLNYGANQAYSIAPAVGYHIADVLVDGVSVGAVASYSFTGITANHTIAASFALNGYTITASAGANGTISPLGATSVSHGANQSFTITPNTGYSISSITVDGTPVAVTNPYTFTGVTANHTIDSSFSSAAIPVFRFVNLQNNDHFYTADVAEKNKLVTNLPATWKLENSSFLAYASSQAGLIQIYRLVNLQNNQHFYTASITEKNKLVAMPTVWKLESNTFFAYPSSQPGLLPVYRLVNLQNDQHFYTSSITEKDKLAAMPNVWKFESIAFFVPTQ